MKKVIFFLTFLIFFLSGITLSQTQVENCSSCGFLKPPFLTDYDVTKRNSLSHIPFTNFFTLNDTNNIYINLIPKDDLGLKIITLIFYSPDGNIYLKKKVPIKSSNNIVENSISIPGYRFPQKIKGGKILRIGNFGRKRVIPIPFAVSGTYISNYHLTGTWEVKIFINNETKPCYNLFFTIGE